MREVSLGAFCGRLYRGWGRREETCGNALEEHAKEQSRVHGEAGLEMTTLSQQRGPKTTAGSCGRRQPRQSEAGVRPVRTGEETNGKWRQQPAGR